MDREQEVTLGGICNGRHKRPPVEGINLLQNQPLSLTCGSNARPKTAKDWMSSLVMVGADLACTNWLRRRDGRNVPHVGVPLTSHPVSAGGENRDEM